MRAGGQALQAHGHQPSSSQQIVVQLTSSARLIRLVSDAARPLGDWLFRLPVVLYSRLMHVD